MKIFFASLFVFSAAFFIFFQDTNASTAFDSSSRSSLTIASLAAGLPPVPGREDRERGLPPAEREITKPPELEYKPIPAPTRGLPPTEQKFTPKEDRRPGLPPSPTLSPIIREKEDRDPGLPRKNR